MSDKQSLALSLIRPSATAKIFDRTFLFAVVLVVIGLVLRKNGDINGKELLDFVMWVGGLWFGAEKLKDAFIGGAAVRSSEPQTVAVGGDLKTGDAATPVVEATQETPPETKTPTLSLIAGAPVTQDVDLSDEEETGVQFPPEEDESLEGIVEQGVVKPTWRLHDV